MLRGVLLLSVVSACATSDAVICADGAVCPGGTMCVSVTSARMETVDRCIASGQLAPCVDQAELAPCTLDGDAGTCHGGACFTNECGNELLDLAEKCDDGNSNSGDGCAADCRSDETCGNGVPDPAMGEQCDRGDVASHDDCSSTCQDETPTWRSFMEPSALVDVAYDENRHRVVALRTGNSVSLHEWDGARWRELPLLLPPRDGARVAFDRAHASMLMFAGIPADTWTFGAHGWTQASVSVAPDARMSTAMAYDPRHGRVVLFGGGGTQTMLGTQVFADTWSWDGTTWTSIATAGPEARYGSSLVPDEKRGVLVLLGGYDRTDTAITEVWKLDGDTWTLEASQLAGAPAAKQENTGAWDPVNERVMLVRGDRDIWEWDGTSWTQMSSIPGVGAFVGMMTTDRDRRRVVAVGGDGTVFEFDGSAWTQPGTEAWGSGPATVFGAAASVPARGELVLFGGAWSTSASDARPDTWRWDGAWTSIAQASAPAARIDASLTFDPVRDVYVLFGGRDSGGALLGDIHILHRTTWQWSTLTPATAPSARAGSAMAWDAPRGRAVLFSGATGNTFFPPDTWTWDGTTWTAQTPATTPPARAHASIAFDPIRQQVVLFGGLVSVTPQQGMQSLYQDDTWAWNGTTWTPVASAVRPPARAHAALAWDAGRGHLMLVGGNRGAEVFDDAWELTETGWRYVAANGAVTPRTGHVLVSAVDGAGVVMLGGADRLSSLLSDRALLRWDTLDAVDETCRSAADSDGDGAAGCADPDCAYRCLQCGDLVCQGAQEVADTCPGDCM